MAIFFLKQPSSRIVKHQGITYAGDQATYLTTPFGAATQQVRVASQVAGFFAVDNSTTVTAGVNAYLPANQAPEYITTTPGQWLAFTSTSSSTGFLTCTEMS